MTRVDDIIREFGRPTVVGMVAAVESPGVAPAPTADVTAPAGPAPTDPTPAVTASASRTPEPPASQSLEPRGEHGLEASADAAHESLPQVARNAAGAWLRAAGWTAGTSLRVSQQLRRLAADPASAQQLVEDVREVAREFLGVSELDAQVQAIAPLIGAGGTLAPTKEALRAQGERLLRAAADVGFDEGAHPAFGRILSEISPDEARILRLLALEGPQPMVDVRAGTLIGSGTQLIAAGLTMIGSQAGLRWRDRIPVYLTNLARLGLAEATDDPLERPAQYQLLEAQPDVLALLHDTPRSRPVRRRVALTGLGREFCTVCLPLELSLLEAGPAVD